MRILDRYIALTVLQSTAVVTVVLMALFGFISFVGEFGDIGRGNYGALQAGIYTLMLMPNIVYQMFPLMVLLGSIIGLGILAGNSELIVIRAAGVSVWRIVWSAMQAGLLLTVIMIIIGEFVAPASEIKAQSLRANALNEQVGFHGEMGLWARDGDAVVHIKDVLAAESVANVSIYEFDVNHKMSAITQAKHADFENGIWVLKDVSRSVLSGQSVQTTHPERVEWRSMLAPQMISVVAIQPEYLSVVGTYHYIEYLQKNGLDATKYVLSLWKKAISPLVIAVMVFLAVPFVFGPLRSVGIGARIFFGVLLGIGFYLADQTIAQLGLVYNFPLPVAVSVAPLLFLGIAALLMRRVR
ncbi:MAG: LPS export ABC transporter permease LptG [Gammaproteobacteria bacterium]|nr:LPS export ABC transporter permease LptG [Gammaproteobacteria bacterium]